MTPENDRTKFRIYSKQSLVDSNLMIGKPMSVVLYQSQNAADKQWCAAFVVRRKFKWCLYCFSVMAPPIYNDPIGFAYFNIALHPGLLELTGHKQLSALPNGFIFWKYGYLLPNLWTQPLEEHPYYSYCILLDDYQHLNPAFHFTTI